MPSALTSSSSCQLAKHHWGLFPSLFMPIWFPWLQNFFGYRASPEPVGPQIHPTSPAIIAGLRNSGVWVHQVGGLQLHETNGGP